MPDRSAVSYIYDGSFEGFLSLVFESWRKKELPSLVFPAGEEQPTLFPSFFIETDTAHAQRVKKGIVKAGGTAVLINIERCFLSCAAEKELLLLDYIRLCFVESVKVLSMHVDETVRAVEKAALACAREGHHYKGFARFSVHGGVMTAVIEPKNCILPLIADHFCERYHEESFIIFDKTNSLALIYSKGSRVLIPMENFEPPRADTGELETRRLWKLFYNTIAIEQRENPHCRMSLMPKRFWSRLTEMEGNAEFPILPQPDDFNTRTVGRTNKPELPP